MFFLLKLPLNKDTRNTAKRAYHFVVQQKAVW